MNDDQKPALLPWSTPRLELLGTMNVVRSDAGGDMDLDGLNQDPITGS